MGGVQKRLPVAIISQLGAEFTSTSRSGYCGERHCRSHLVVFTAAAGAAGAGSYATDYLSDILDRVARCYRSI